MTTTMTMTPETMYEKFRRADFLLALNQPDEAAKVLAPIVDAVPDHTAALELYARALFASAQLGRAEQALRSLVELRPDDGLAHLALARTLQRQSKPAEATVHLRLAEALGQAA